MPQISSSKKYLKAGKLILAILALCLVAGFVFSYIDSRFRIRTIKVEGLKSGQLYGLETIKDASSIFLTEKEIARTIIDSNPEVSSVRVTKAYPGTVVLNITPAHPLAYFEVDGGYFLLDGEGKIISKTKGSLLPDQLPVIHYFQKFPYASMQPGDMLDLKDVKMALIFVRKTQGLGLAVNTVDIDGVDVIGLNLNRKAILFSSEKDTDSQVYELEQIMRQFHIQGKDFKRMDLRFNKPVLELDE